MEYTPIKVGGPGGKKPRTGPIPMLPFENLHDCNPVENGNMGEKTPQKFIHMKPHKAAMLKHKYLEDALGQILDEVVSSINSIKPSCVLDPTLANSFHQLGKNVDKDFLLRVKNKDPEAINILVPDWTKRYAETKKKQMQDRVLKRKRAAEKRDKMAEEMAEVDKMLAR